MILLNIHERFIDCERKATYKVYIRGDLTKIGDDTFIT